MSGERRDLQSLWPQEEDVVPIAQATPSVASQRTETGRKRTRPCVRGRPVRPV